MKSRISFRSEQEAIEGLKKHVGVTCASIFHQHFFFQLSADNPEQLHKLLKSKEKKHRHKAECIQLLHHVYVYGASAGLFIIGNNSKCLYAVEVSFSRDLLNAYERIVKFIYNNFKYFYNEKLDDFPHEQIEKALEHRNQSQQKKGIIDMHAFMTNFKLWRALNVNVNDSVIKFLLP